MDERELVDRARNGDRRALDQLLRAHYDRIYAVCRRMSGNDSDAQDATQDALVAIVRGLDRYDGRAAFGTWAYRVATNACLDELRRRKRRPDPGLPETERPPPAGNPSVSDTVTSQVVLDDALAQLSPEFREPVVLRDVGGLNYAEIADQLGIPAGTVRSRIARGRAQLADFLRETPGVGNQGDPDRRPRERP